MNWDTRQKLETSKTIYSSNEKLKYPRNKVYNKALASSSIQNP